MTYSTRSSYEYPSSDRPHQADSENVFLRPVDQPTVTVVIPTLNEEENLPHVLPQIPAWVHEVIVVDAYSTDRTIDIARQLRADVRIVMQEGQGKGSALRLGFEAATGDIIVMLDADGSTSPKEIPAFVGALLSGADFAKGSRFLQGGGTTDMSWFRRLGNWGFVMLVRLIFGGQYSDLCYGYNAFWRRVLPVIQLDGTGFEIETMMNVRVLKAGLSVIEVPSFEAERIHGHSHLRTIPDGWRVLKTIVSEGLTKMDESLADQESRPHLFAATALDLKICPHCEGRGHVEFGQSVGGMS